MKIESENATGKGMNPIVLLAMGNSWVRLGSFALVRLTAKVKKKFAFKPVLRNLKTDLVSHPDGDEVDKYPDGDEVDKYPNGDEVDKYPDGDEMNKYIHCYLQQWLQLKVK